MCGRFTQFATWAEVFAFSQPLEIQPPTAPITPSWNVAPRQHALIIRKAPNGALGSHCQWGFSAREPRPINARVETVLSSALFGAAMGKRRCAVPVGGWYEWRQEGKRKQPYYFHAPAVPLLLLAGIWQDDTFALLTTEALAVSKPIHGRSPVLLATHFLPEWLSAEADAKTLLAGVLHSQPQDLRVHPVSDKINFSGSASGVGFFGSASGVGFSGSASGASRTSASGPELAAAIAATQLF